MTTVGNRSSSLPREASARGARRFFVSGTKRSRIRVPCTFGRPPFPIGRLANFHDAHKWPGRLNFFQQLLRLGHPQFSGRQLATEKNLGQRHQHPFSRGRGTGVKPPKRGGLFFPRGGNLLWVFWGAATGSHFCGTIFFPKARGGFSRGPRGL